MEELSYKEIQEIEGGASFAYRAGQVLAVAMDGADGIITSYGAIAALCDWFS